MAGASDRKRVAVYPGSFDPLTNGHVDIILRGARLFDRIIVALLENADKSPMFTVRERLEITKKAFAQHQNVDVGTFDGLLVDYVRLQGANVIVRGLRAISDFEFEFKMALMNRSLNEDISTLFLMPHAKYTHISSSMVREVASLSGDISAYVPVHVDQALRKKYK